MLAGLEKNTAEQSHSAHHRHVKHKARPTKTIIPTKHIITTKHITSTHRIIIRPSSISLSSSVIPSFTTMPSPTPIAEGTILTGSSLPIPLPPPSSSTSIINTPMIIGGVVGGLVMCSIIVCYTLYRRIKRKKECRAMKASTVIIHDDDDDDSHKYGGKWKAKDIWSTLDSTASSKCVEVDTPPPAYYNTTRAKKRLTQDSEISKQGSSLFVKQYSPQLAYSPSHHTTLEIDQGTLSPSHTLVDTRRSSSCLQHTSLDEEEHQQQRRSFQHYPNLLDITPSMAPPDPFQGGMLLHTKEFDAL